MADMYDSGYHCFTTYADSNRLQKFWEQWLGVFNPFMTAEEAQKLLEHDIKMTRSANEQFARGWNQAQKEWHEIQNNTCRSAVEISK